MYFLAPLLLLSRTVSYEAALVCDGIILHGKYYEKELLFDGMGKAYNLALHSFTGLLFFSHVLRNSSKVDFAVQACHLERRICRQVPGLAGGFAIGVDHRYDDMYLGGHSGLYKYNFRTKSADYFAEDHKSIWHITIEKYFYYVEYPSQKLYAYSRGRFDEVPSTFDIEIDKFYISKSQKIYYSNSTGLFKINKAFDLPIMLKKRFQVRQIAEDMFGDIYFASFDGIYMELKNMNRIIKAAAIEDVYGIVFVKWLSPIKDELLYSDKHGIYRLEQSKHKQLCLSALQDEKKEALKIRFL